ncbi:ABC transporter ATP-binding protein [Streptomyces sp. NPDC001719]
MAALHRAQGRPDMTPHTLNEQGETTVSDVREATVPSAAGVTGQARESRLTAESVTLAYDQRVIAENLSVAVPDRSFTVIVGPNACGKSTLLRALSRMLKPTSGAVLLDGAAIDSYPAKQVARTLGLLPQSSVAPDGITVADLVARGRYPHQGLLRQWSREDERIVVESMTATGVDGLADRHVDELSGGQRQRVWIAMALAQQTPLLLLDEPTTYLDIQHQIDVLDLCAELHEEQGRTLVAVLHDLNHAARYATHLIAMRDGRVVAEGEPREVVTAELVEKVFGLRCQVIDDPETGTPLVVPAARRRR